MARYRQATRTSTLSKSFKPDTAWHFWLDTSLPGHPPSLPCRGQGAPHLTGFIAAGTAPRQAMLCSFRFTPLLKPHGDRGVNPRVPRLAESQIDDISVLPARKEVPIGYIVWGFLSFCTREVPFLADDDQCPHGDDLPRGCYGEPRVGCRRQRRAHELGRWQLLVALRSRFSLSTCYGAHPIRTESGVCRHSYPMIITSQTNLSSALSPNRISLWACANATPVQVVRKHVLVGCLPRSTERFVPSGRPALGFVLPLSRAKAYATRLKLQFLYTERCYIDLLRAAQKEIGEVRITQRGEQQT
jgi:hypothetical protein